MGWLIGRRRYDPPGMATVRGSPGAIGSETSGASAALRTREGLGFAAVVTVVLVPLAVVLVAIAGASWHPPSDLAVEVMRISEVGGRHTPLVGAHSRYGWDHPGPLLFWGLAPFRWRFGTTGVLVGVVVLNALAIVGAMVIARRRGGLPLVVLVGGAVLTLTWALGPSLLADPWNPWAAVLPFFTFVLLAWDLADGELRALPWLVGVGTYLVQTHVGYTPLVLGLGLAAALLARGAVRHRPAEGGAVRTSTARRSGLAALVVAAVLWIPPVLQQLFGAEGNLTAILRFVRNPSEPAIGWRNAWGILGTELGFPGAWLARPRARRLRCEDELDPSGSRAAARDGGARRGGVAPRRRGRRPAGDPRRRGQRARCRRRRAGHRRSRELPGPLVVGDRGRRLAVRRLVDVVAAVADPSPGSGRDGGGGGTARAGRISSATRDAGRDRSSSISGYMGRREEPAPQLTDYSNFGHMLGKTASLVSALTINMNIPLNY